MTTLPIIVGGGPAGMAAAIELSRNGVRSILLEEASRLGGVVYRGPLRENSTVNHLGKKYRRALCRLRRDYIAHADLIDVKLKHRVLGIDGSDRLAVLSSSETLLSLDYTDLILATGCQERAVPFPGWQLPGVMLLGGLQLQIKSNLTRPYEPVVIAGSGPLLFVVASQLHAAGVKIAGVFEACSFRKLMRESYSLLNQPLKFFEGVGSLAYLRRHNIPVEFGWGVVSARGDTAIKDVTIAPYNNDWTPDLTRARVLTTGTLAVGYGFIPRTQLSLQSDLRHDYNDDGILCLCTNADQQVDQKGIFAAGDVCGLLGGEGAILAGRIAAISLLQRHQIINAREAARRKKRLSRELRSLKRFYRGVFQYTRRGIGQLTLPQPDTVICRCENVVRAKIDRAIEQGVRDVVTLKMLTRVGMGDCQGRVCGAYCVDRLRHETGKDKVGWLRPRFPIEPIPLSSLAGFDSEVTVS